MGHSMGAGVCMYYASVFPERVDRLAVFDIIGLPPVPVKKQHKSLRKSIEQSIAIHEKLAKAASHPPPSYDYMDAVARVYMANAMLHGTDSVTKEAVQTLMKRGLRKTQDGKYTWTTDLRLRIQSPFNVVLEQVRLRTIYFEACLILRSFNIVFQHAFISPGRTLCLADRPPAPADQGLRLAAVHVRGDGRPDPEGVPGQ
jgi:hypothetical protein